MKRERSQVYSLLDYCDVPRPKFNVQNKPATKKLEQKKPKPPQPQIQMVQLSLLAYIEE